MPKIGGLVNIVSEASFGDFRPKKCALFHNHGFINLNGPTNNLKLSFFLWVFCLELQSSFVLTFMRILFKKNTSISGIFVNSELHRTERGSRKATDLLRLRRRKRHGDYRSPNINLIFLSLFIFFHTLVFPIVFFTLW